MDPYIPSAYLGQRYILLEYWQPGLMCEFSYTGPSALQGFGSFCLLRHLQRKDRQTNYRGSKGFFSGQLEYFSFHPLTFLRLDKIKQSQHPCTYEKEPSPRNLYRLWFLSGGQSTWHNVGHRPIICYCNSCMRMRAWSWCRSSWWSQWFRSRKVSSKRWSKGCFCL